MDVWKEAVAAGLEHYGLVAQDPEVAVLGARLAADMATELARHVRADDECLLALPSALVLSHGPSKCLVVVLKDRLVVCWESGRFRKKMGTVVVPSNSVTEVTWGKGTTTGTRASTVLSVRHGSDTTHFALPLRQTNKIGSAIKSALLTGELPADEEPGVGPAARPDDIEEGIARWFAFRRGEIPMSDVGVRPVRLMGWMTDEEKALDARLSKQSKSRS